MGFGPSQRKVLGFLSDGVPRSHRRLVKETGLGYRVVEMVLRRLWRRGAILRTEKRITQHEEIFKGRSGFKRNLRLYHLYVLCPKGVDSIVLGEGRFVSYDEKLNRQRSGKSKAQLLLGFLRENQDRGFYSKEIVDALKDKGVKPYDVMPNVRRFEKKGLVFVRGYRTHSRETPFKDGYIITWIDQEKSRRKALEEAVERTNKVLEKNPYETSIVSRIHLIRDQILAAAKTRDIVSVDFIKNKVGGSEAEVERAIKRSLQLFPDLQQIKLFGAYRHFYHNSLLEADLKAAIAMKQNYIRIVKGRASRIGHNWESCVEWFIDTFHKEAIFRTQKHRTKRMDPRRITIHLTKSVGKRRMNAEVDRVWDATQGLFTNPVTYVLECKWGVIRKEDLDDFLGVLRWSKEFGVDTPDGRQVKQGVIGVFAGSAFSPRQNVRFRDGSKISLAAYAARANIQLLKAADFNEKLRKRGCTKSVTVQKICRIAKDEKEVREILDSIWEKSSKGEEILAKVVAKNKEIYDFEKKLEDTR